MATVSGSTGTPLSTVMPTTFSMLELSNINDCNTLSYKSVRKYWVKNYPDAVIFGTLGKIPMGLYVVNSPASAPSTTKAFSGNLPPVIREGICL